MNKKNIFIKKYPGIWKRTFGKKERFTPLAIRDHAPSRPGLAMLPTITANPLQRRKFTTSIKRRGITITYNLDKGEQIFGFGLQLKSFNQTGKKKTLRVNSDPVADTGDSHAPVPFFISTAGYGMLIDTARYVSFYCGSHRSTDSIQPVTPHDGIATSTAELYKKRDLNQSRMIIDLPAATGVDVYVFGGATLLEVIQRYNLFCGGGCMPALWGLGNWYRGKGDASAVELAGLMSYFRAAHIPVDVLGLEPGWQSRSYSCSFEWNKKRFEDPEFFLAQARDQHYKVNVWEHAFVHAESPLFKPLKKHAADLAVWEGLVPDFTQKQTREIFAKYHSTELVKLGISGFKLDECDNSDYIQSPWSFPEAAHFPSGIDGDQMHSLFGLLYQQTIYSIYKKQNQRTYCEVRSSHAGAVPYPFVLYSDLYEHQSFIRGLVNSGFCGLLWCPEVREAKSPDDLIRRLQTVVFSPQSLVNAWYLKNPPWRQINTEANNRDEFMDGNHGLERHCKALFELRMQLVPYLYAAFARYHFEGVPPFRALVTEYADDPATHTIDDQYLMGDNLMVAPVVAPAVTRAVYLPHGTWYCFWTDKRYQGGMVYEIDAPIERIPVFVKENSIMPLATPVEYIAKDTVFEVTVKTYGDNCRDFVLFEDDGETFNYDMGRYNKVTLSCSLKKGKSEKRVGKFQQKRYNIEKWQNCAA